MTAQVHVPVNGAEVYDLPTHGRRRLQVVDGATVGAGGEATPHVKRKRPSRIGAAWRAFVADLDNWGAMAWAPPSMNDWVAARTPERVPDDWRLRLLWHADHWTVGLALAGVSVVLFTLAATVRWVACHTARRWVAIALTCTYVTWLSQA